jgi:hypothetical protein
MKTHFEEAAIAVEPVVGDLALCDNAELKEACSYVFCFRLYLYHDTQNLSTHCSKVISHYPSTRTSLPLADVHEGACSIRYRCIASPDDETLSDKSYALSSEQSSEDSICSSHVDELNNLLASDDVAPLAKEDNESFISLRITYLIVTLVVMLADGLQGERHWRSLVAYCHYIAFSLCFFVVNFLRNTSLCPL